MSTFHRNQAVEIPRSGLRESLQAPGVVPLPLVPTEGQKLAAQLEDALNTGAGAVAALGAMAADRRAEAERRARLAEIEREKAAEFERGQGRRAAREDLAGLLHGITIGKLVPLDDETPEEFADRVVAERAQGLGPEFLLGYGDSLKPQLIASVYDRHTRLADESANRLAGFEVENILAAQGEEEILAGVARFKELDPRFDDTTAVDQLLAPALSEAAKIGDRDRVELIGRVVDSLGGRKLTFERAEAERTLSLFDRQREQDDRDLAETSIFASLNRRDPVEKTLGVIDFSVREGMISEPRAFELRRSVIASAQGRSEEELRTSILLGRLKPDDVRAEVERRVALDPGDPSHLDAAVGASLLATAERRETRSLARDQVLLHLAGAPVLLTEGQHGEAFADLLGPEGAGFIDETNRIARPDALAGAVLGAQLLPPQTREVVLGSLASGNPADAAAAVQVIGAIGNGSARMYASLLEAAGPELEPAITAAVEAYQRGRVTDAASAGALVSTIRERLKDATPAPSVSREVLEDLGRDVELAKETDRVLRGVRKDLPHTKNFTALFHVDWLWQDPSLAGGDVSVTRRVERWFAERFAQLRTRMPREMAVKRSREYAEAQVRNAVDYVRWGGEVAPVMIDLGEGLRMPEHLRWGEGFEEEAREDLAATGFDVDTIATMRPFIDPTLSPGEDPTDRMGWVFVTEDGDTLRDAAGAVVVFRPSDKAAEANAKYRRELERRMQSFKGPPRFTSPTPSDYLLTPEERDEVFRRFLPRNSQPAGG